MRTSRTRTEAKVCWVKWGGIAACFLVIASPCGSQTSAGRSGIEPAGRAVVGTQHDVERYLKDGVPLPSSLIGPVHIFGIECRHPVDFTHMIFTGDAFFRVTFNARADFTRAEFQGETSFAGSQFIEASFAAAEFLSGADFTATKFSQAYFWRTLFDGPADFEEMQVQHVEGDGKSEGFLLPNESNFSYSRFAGRANFKRAMFQGPVYYYGTRFAGPALFSEAKFLKAVQFQDIGESITVARGDFVNMANGRWAAPVSAQLGDLANTEGDQPGFGYDRLFTKLVKANVLRKSAEQISSRDLPPEAVLYADFPAGQTEEQWKARLERAGLSGAELAVFNAVRKALAGPMFAPGSECSYESAEFPEQSKEHFLNTDLSHCRFFQSTLQRVRFVGERWDQQPMLFGRRAALYDERNASSRSEFLELERLYTALRSQSENNHASTPADDFQFGAMEMARRAGASWRILHKYLNGYNTSVLLPLIWLILFLGGAFPLLYMRAGVSNNYISVLFHTLYLSSLLKDQEPVVSSTAARLIQVMQGLVIGLLLGAAGFVAKRKLGL